jgi:hypothetical protein
MSNSAFPLIPGEIIRIEMTADNQFNRCVWFPKGTHVMATVERVFKNGKLAVALHGTRNRSDDGRITVHLSPGDIVAIEEAE